MVLLTRGDPETQIVKKFIFLRCIIPTPELIIFYWSDYQFICSFFWLFEYDDYRLRTISIIYSVDFPQADLHGSLILF